MSVAMFYIRAMPVAMPVFPSIIVLPAHILTMFHPLEYHQDDPQDGQDADDRYIPIEHGVILILDKGDMEVS